MTASGHPVTGGRFPCATRYPLIAAGYRPALVQESNKDNRQAILKIPREGDDKTEQSLANRLVMTLNKKYGDSELSEVVHPFRMAGFANKKSGKGSPFTRVIDAEGCICPRAADELAELRRQHADEIRRRPAQAAQRQRVQQQETRISGGLDTDEAKRLYVAAAARVLAWVRRLHLPEDPVKLTIVSPSSCCGMDYPRRKWLRPSSAWRRGFRSVTVMWAIISTGQYAGHRRISRKKRNGRWGRDFLLDDLGIRGICITYRGLLTKRGK